MLTRKISFAFFILERETNPPLQFVNNFILDNLKNLYMEYNFYAFYSKFSRHDGLENAISEHSKRLNFQNFSEGPPLKPHRGSLTAPLDAQFYCALP